VKVARHAPEAISILRRRNGLPGVVVMAIGGNDDPHNVGAFRDAVQATRRIAGPTRCVVWPNHYSRRPVAGTTFDGFNAVLDEFDKRYRNFRVVNRAAVVRRHPGWLAPDGLHVNATGYRARARAIAAQVKRC
jgi:lysophospholipase L1-like esterase